MSEVVRETAEAGGSGMAFAVSPARDFDELREAFRLVYQQYLRSGLTVESASRLRFFLRDLCPHTTTLVAIRGGRVVGTAAATIHGPTQIPCAPLFQEQVATLCQPGRVVAEGTKFASERSPSTDPRGVGRMSAVATELLRWLFAWCCLRRVTDWLLVVHPRVSDFYVESLGFRELATISECAHVRGNPGTLLRLGVREVLRGEVELPDEGRRLFLGERQREGFAGEVCHLRSADVTVLLLDDKEVLAKSSSGERRVLSEAYPGVPLPQIQELYQRSEPHPIPQVGEAYRRAPLCEENVAARPFPLRAYLREIQIVLDVLARERDATIQLTVADDVPDGLVGSADLLGRMLFLLARRQLSAVAPTPLPWMHIGAGRKDGAEIALLLSGALHAAAGSVFLEEVRHLAEEGRLVSAGIDARGILFVSVPFLVLDEVSLRMGEVLHSASCRMPSTDLGPAAELTPFPLAVLVVDDNLVTRVLLQRLLSKWGHHVTVAVDGIEASAAAKQRAFDLVLLDIQMPRRDGFDTVPYLRAAERQHRRVTTICALTTFVMRKDAARCIAAGMDRYLAKPVHVDELQTLLSEIQARIGQRVLSAHCR